MLQNRFSGTETMAAASLVAGSVTNLEISRYWKQKRLTEEDHLYAAIKAAARVRARNLSDDDHLRFECYLKESDGHRDDKHISTMLGIDDNKELMVGIKDWWTKSKYAYLNEPAMMFLDKPGQRNCTYLPNFLRCNSASP
ncbi:uncharacterized protein LOC127264434 [Andrographis paniculata]|uniref:uncharacterized protein LOC127264434 n=1 Tax=Andrographis paniculata TaxID=175694 RepID=UPI0021E95E8A|nr:uncharacterized protein LOC127264434 [Andrographis paniculata]